MKKSILLPLALLAFPMTLSAADYFMSPEGKGEKDATSWDNAAPVEQLASLIQKCSAGDAIYLMAGTYNLCAGETVNYPLVAGITIMGGFPADATGTDITGYDSKLNVTILDAQEKNGQAKALFTLEPTEEQFGNRTLLKGLTIMNCRPNTTANAGVVFFCKTAKADMVEVIMKNNKCTKGGIVAVAHGSEFMASDCHFLNNENTTIGNASGRQVCISTAKGIAGHPNTLVALDKCLFLGNKWEEGKAKWGGLINLGDGTAQFTVNLIMTHCFADGNQQAMDQKGGWLRVGSYSSAFLAFNTGFNFKINNDNLTWSGSVISTAGNVGAITLMGNLFLNEDASHTAFGLDATLHADSKSLGYNVVNKSPTDKDTSFNWNLPSDKWNHEALQNEVLDTENATESGLISAMEAYKDVPLAEIQAVTVPELFKTFASRIDLSKDVTGTPREALSYRGAYSPSKLNTGINETMSETEISVIKMAKDVYRILGSENAACDVYDLTGKRVAVKNQSSDILDLSGCPDGIYIFRIAGKSFKIAK